MERPTSLKAVWVLAILRTSLDGIGYLIAGFNWRLQVAPQIESVLGDLAANPQMIQSDLVPFKLILLGWGTFLPVFGLIALICVIGLLFWSNWARILFIMWSLIQILISWGRKLLASHFAASALKHVARAQELSGGTSHQVDPNVSRSVDVANQVARAVSGFDPILLGETVILILFVYYFSRPHIRDQFQ